MTKHLPASYCGEIDFWKFICCIVIVVHHSFQIFDDRLYMAAGSICVEFFFIVSGYLTAASVARKNEKFESDKIGTQTVDFLFHKIKGFIYCYIFAVITCLAVRIAGEGLSATVLNEKITLSIVDLLLLNSSGLPHWYIFSASWYLSAMLLGLAVIYPIMRKNRDLFINIIAPITALILYSVMLNRDGYIGEPEKWYYIVTKGFLRSIAGLSLGSTAYALCERIKKHNINRSVSVMFTLVEFAAMAFALFALYKNKQNLTAAVIFAFFVCVVISATRLSITAPLFNRPIFLYLGKLSMAVYLCHQTAAYAFKYIIDKSLYLKITIDLNPAAKPVTLLIYVIVSVLLGIICLKICSLVSGLIKKKSEKKSPA